MTERKIVEGQGAAETIDLLRRTANELEKEPGMVTGCILIVAGQPGAFLQEGPCSVVHARGPVPHELFDGLVSVSEDLRLLAERQGRLQ